jgi:hypothetical protein
MLGDSSPSDRDESMMTLASDQHTISDAIEALKSSVLKEPDDAVHFGGKSPLQPEERKARRPSDVANLAIQMKEMSARKAIEGLGEMLTFANRAGTNTASSAFRIVGSTKAKDSGGRSTIHRIQGDVERGYAFGTWSVMNLSKVAVAEVQRRVSIAICDAVMKLLQDVETSDSAHYTVERFRGNMPESAGSDGDSLGMDPARSRVTQNGRLAPAPTNDLPTVQVWSSPQEARLAIIRHALVSRYGHIKNVPAGAAMVGAPLVLLIREHVFSASSPEELNAIRSFDQSANVYEDDDTFRDWRAASLGMAVLAVVDVDSLEDVSAVIDAQLSRERTQSNLVPILVVFCVLHDSTISANALSLRSICDVHGAKMHVEGPAISTVARMEDSVESVATFQSFDTFLLEPAAWFGVPACAATTFHQAGSIMTEREEIEHNSSKPNSFALERSTATSLGPLFGLWMLLSRLGLYRARSIVSEATSLSQIFIDKLSAVPNIGTVACGLRSTVKITYIMSRSDRLIRKYKAREQVSKVNTALFGETLATENQLQLTLSAQNNQTWIVFSPSRLLESGTLSIPGSKCVHDLVQKLVAAAKKYEMSCIGSSPYMSRVCRLSDYHAVSEDEVGASIVLCYGAFRIVPEEFHSSWREDDAKVEIVHDLTSRLAVVLATRSQKYENTTRSRQIESQRNGKQANAIKKHGCRFAAPLPFEFFLHAENVNGVPDFLTVELYDSKSSSNAVNEAAMAADFVSDCVKEVCNQWREREGTPVRPNALSNVAGLDSYIANNQCHPSKRKTGTTQGTMIGHLHPCRADEAVPEARTDRNSEEESPGLAREDALNLALKHHDENAEEDPDDEYYSAEEAASGGCKIAREHGDAIAKQRRQREGFEKALGGTGKARSHWFDESHARGNRQQKRGETNPRRRDSDSSGSSENENASGLENSSSGGQNSESGSESDYSDDGEKSENEDQRRGSEKQSGNESSQNSEEEVDADSDSASADGDTESENSRQRQSRSQSIPNRGLLGWWRGENISLGAGSKIGKENSTGSAAGSAHSSSDAEESLQKENTRELSQRDDLESDDEDESDDSAEVSETDDEVLGNNRNNNNPRLKGSAAACSEGFSRFGFNWLSKKVLPADEANHRNVSSSRSRPERNGHSHGAAGHQSGSLISSKREKPIGRRRGDRNRRYSSTSSHSGSPSDRSDCSERRSDASSDEVSHRPLRKTAAVPKRESRGWFSGSVAGGVPRTNETRYSRERNVSRTTRSRDISLSSESSGYEVRRSDYRSAPGRDISGPSSVMSWFGSGKSTASTARAGPSTENVSSRRRR